MSADLHRYDFPRGDYFAFWNRRYAAVIWTRTFAAMTSDLTRSASAGVAGLWITMVRSGRPSTAKAEYSSAISLAAGWRKCLVPSP